MTGCFIAVVGPSGAGKDSLIDAARQHFKPHGAVKFVRRVITRSGSAGGEDHISIDGDSFDERAATGAFALFWQAHGLKYGIPAEVDEALAHGTAAVANLSRGVIGQMRARYPKRRIIVVTADPEVLASRLAERGRETQEQIADRLRRAPYNMPEGDDVLVVHNNGTLATAESAFIDAIQTAL